MDSMAAGDAERSTEFMFMGLPSAHEIPADLLALLPAWARWLAQDADGSWWCYEHEPNLAHLNWYENEVGRSVRIRKDASNPDWRETLLAVPPA